MNLCKYFYVRSFFPRNFIKHILHNSYLLKPGRIVLQVPIKCIFLWYWKCSWVKFLKSIDLIYLTADIITINFLLFLDCLGVLSSNTVFWCLKLNVTPSKLIFRLKIINFGTGRIFGRGRITLKGILHFWRIQSWYQIITGLSRLK